MLLWRIFVPKPIVVLNGIEHFAINFRSEEINWLSFPARRQEYTRDFFGKNFKHVKAQKSEMDNFCYIFKSKLEASSL